MKFLWTEDSKAGFHYWKLVNEHLFNGTFIVESKGSNQKLLDAVRDLSPKEGDIYCIAFDIVYDNMDVMNKYLELKQLADKNPKQIRILDMTCFEFIVLSFRYLIQWTGTGRKDKIAIREHILSAFYEHKIDISRITDSRTLDYLMGFKNYSTEKVLKSVTAELTDQDAWSLKGKEMGKCWHEDCCVLEINKGKHCRVEQEMSGYEKMQVFLADDETQRIIQDMR